MKYSLSSNKIAVVRSLKRNLYIQPDKKRHKKARQRNNYRFYVLLGLMEERVDKIYDKCFPNQKVCDVDDGRTYTSSSYIYIYIYIKLNRNFCRNFALILIWRPCFFTSALSIQYFSIVSPFKNAFTKLYEFWKYCCYKWCYRVEFFLFFK